MIKKITAIFFCITLSLPNPAYAGPTWKDLNLPTTLIAEESEFHEVTGVQEDPSEPGFLIFTVSTQDAVSKVEGIADLRKWVHEAEVLVRLDRENKTGGGVAEGAVESVKGTGRGLKNLVLHPVNSAKGIGRATGKLGDKVGDVFRNKEEGEKGDGFLSSTKRQIAKKMGVDVYSRNPHIQERLSSIAKQQVGGKGVVLVVNFFLPLGLLASAVMTASSLNNAADELVNDKDRIDLYELNKTALLSLAYSPEQVTHFLNHPYYTPREITYIRFYLEKLKPLQGSKDLLDEATKRTEGVEAQKFLHEMQIAADSLENEPDAVGIRVAAEGFFLERKDAVVLICAYDYLDASKLGDRVVDAVSSEKQKLGKSSAEIWNGGVATSRFSGSLLFRGIKVKRMCLFRAGETPDEVPAV